MGGVPFHIPEGWHVCREGNAIEKHFSFDNFESAFNFMASCKTPIEILNHHPEWFNVYNKVHVILTTHDTGGISQLDIDLARKMNQLFTASKT